MGIASVGLVGYGEVGRIFSAGLIAAGVPSVSAWDLKFDGAAARDEALAHAAQHGVHACGGLADLCQRSTLLISAVTASNTLAVAQAVSTHIRPGGFFLDLNSASPGTKQQAAALVDAAGGRYVEAGVMTSVPPHGLRVPMLLGGVHAPELAAQLSDWGMDATVVSERIGVASATKMCRSVMIKGLEALVLESYTTARHYGVEDAMIATLQETFPGIDWPPQGAYFFSRVARHGQRRAEEMREAAHTVREAGFEPCMAEAIAGKHDWMAAQARAGHFDGLAPNPRWQDWADRLLAARGTDPKP
ncbi:MAG: NAD(P)-dependent oxidoreductase [Comamonadaceae bacterium]|nr:MAG: NAD(P)-dependent oxidoreductase [Comamonadaceae bacterium]